MERIRLNLHANAGMKLDRHRDVLQYFQNSADQGNVNAQAAIGKVGRPGAFPGPPTGRNQTVALNGHAASAGQAPFLLCLGMQWVASSAVQPRSSSVGHVAYAPCSP
jgi:SEL1 protein